MLKPGCHPASSRAWRHGDVFERLLDVPIGRHDDALDRAVGRQQEGDAELSHVNAGRSHVLGTYGLPRLDQSMVGRTFGATPDEDVAGRRMSIDP